MPRKKKDIISDYETELRIARVHEMMIERRSEQAIIEEIGVQGWGKRPYAEELIKTALIRWSKESTMDLDIRRKRAVLRLLVLAKTLKPKFEGTPQGIKALVDIEKDINKLEGNYSPEQITHGFDGNTGMDQPIQIIIGGKRKGD